MSEFKYEWKPKNKSEVKVPKLDIKNDKKYDMIGQNLNINAGINKSI